MRLNILMNKMSKLKLHLLLILIAPIVIINLSCNKMTEVDPPVTSLTGEVVYKDDVTAASVLTGLYTSMSSGAIMSGSGGISARTGLSADELSLWSGATDVLQVFYKNALSSLKDNGPWTLFYNYLHTVNAALEGLDKSTVLTPSVKKQLEGEAKFIRAFCYFYLVNLYGPVPLQTATDWRVNAVISRSSKDKVYQQIVTDLTDAKNLLSDNYLGANVQSTTSERVRPTKAAATALLARVYLYLNQWANAESEATLVINNNATYDTVSLNNVFLKNNKEAIWQLQPVQSNRNTNDGNVFILTTVPGTSSPFTISSYLFNAFETGDNRKINWIGSFTNSSGTYYFPYKYKVKTNATITEYLTILRLGEQYLIRAEARAQQNNISGSQNDLNIIRKRARLLNTTANDKTSLLTAIEQERQVELFTEFGHRWLDMKRNNRADIIMPPVTTAKGGTWNTNWQLYPLYYNDIKLNPNLGPNNPGY